MGADNKVVDYLTKVSLELEAGSRPDHMDLTKNPLPHDFVFGAAANGITPFEKALFAGAVGDEQTFQITKDNAYDILGHLRSPLLRHLSVPLPFFLKARITRIDQADNREVIQAMAASLGGCGDGCDCGCGCS